MAKEQKELRVVIMRPTFAGGKPMEVGKTITLPAADAKALVTSGKAVFEEKITDEDKAKIQETEAVLKAKADIKSKAKPSEMAISGKALVKANGGKAKTASNSDAEAAIKSLVDSHKAEQLRQILDDLGVEYEGDANKTTLAALIVENKKD